MPTKKDSALKKKVIKPKKKTTKKKKVTKANKPIVIITQKLPKEKCCTDVKKSGEAYTVPFGFADLAGTRRLGTEVTQKETEVVKPIKTMNEIPKVEKLIPKGPLKIDEGILAKLNQTKPSIPSVADIEDIKPTFKYKPISESFKPIVNVPPKKDSKVKKVVIGIENKRMGQEDALARQIEEAARQRQQTKLDYYNREMSNMPFYEEENIPSISEVQGIPLAEATVKEKRKYVKSGKYSKKPKPQVIEE